MENQEEFLAELTELTLKYRIQVGGCGCCGSPYIVSIQEGTTGKYVADNYGDNGISFQKEN
jgi:hypothetical protein